VKELLQAFVTSNEKNLDWTLRMLVCVDWYWTYQYCLPIRPRDWHISLSPLVSSRMPFWDIKSCMNSHWPLSPSLTCLTVDCFSVPPLAVSYCHPSGCQVFPTGVSQLLAHKSWTTYQPVWCLLNHFLLILPLIQNSISFRSYFLAIS